MKLQRINLENEYHVDMIQNNGFIIEKEDKWTPINVDQLVNHSNYMDNEYRCDCGAFIGQEHIGQNCPRCQTEIVLHSLNFGYTGWVDLSPHVIISPIYYNILKRVLGNNLLKFILGDYKSDLAVQYDDEDSNFHEERAQKKKGRPAPNDIRVILKKIPKSKQQYQGLGHDKFKERFEEILLACAPRHAETPTLIAEKEAVFTSKIPIYSTAFRPESRTAESMFYPRINKWFAKIVAVNCKLEDMTLEAERIIALNYIQNDLIQACEELIKTEISKKEGFVRAEIVGGTFSFSARSVITLDISLRMDEIDAPYPMVIEAFKYKLTHQLATRYNMTLEQAYLYVSSHWNAVPEDPNRQLIISLLDEIMDQGQWIFLLREPTINLASIALLKIRKYKFNDDTISLSLPVLKGFNADFVIGVRVLNCGNILLSIKYLLIKG